MSNVSYLDTLFAEPSNLFDEVNSGPKMREIISLASKLEVSWEGDEMILEEIPESFCENKGRA